MEETYASVAERELKPYKPSVANTDRHVGESPNRALTKGEQV